MSNAYLYIGLGGATGAISRVLLSRAFPAAISGLPVKILLINIIGCFVLGLLSNIMAFYWNASINMRHFLVQVIF